MKHNDISSVALIFGGRGYESDVSVKGADFVYGLIKDEGFDLLPIFIDKDGVWQVCRERETAVLPSVIASGCVSLAEVYPICHHGRGGFLIGYEFTEASAAIPLLHGNFGEDGSVQGALECAKIPYVGCDVSASALARDKGYVKAIARVCGIPTVDWVIADTSLDKTKALVSSRLGYPAFLKPCRLGSSIGATPIRNDEELEGAYVSAKALSERIIIEGLVEIEKELECAYYSVGGKELFTNLGKIAYTDGFYDYNSKYTEAKGVVVSDESGLTESEESVVKDYSRRLVTELGIRDISRIDFFKSRDGKILFNEINTFPGFTDTSLYPRLIARHGISARELVLSLIDECIGRGA